ncbi:IclR family transcriptional regulator [Tepidibacillus fermentans]|uniref:IclR family transcriptional regulator n=1 Tax=Tepidibacillus fermentans TaxID=1281767 RepID=A0A4R3KGY1_9BACI|nr:IclR family transcriptional regulator [Tepidibacillus fermentans]TCS82510.1 IclR family transcriptional regulator [Tepidibacillus fermentans]
MKKDNEEKRAMVRTAERSLDILLSFLEAKELSLTEIAKHVSLHKSTVYRLVQTLENKGFLIKSMETEKYRLGYKCLELAANMEGKNDPAVLFLPEMQSLRDNIGETVSLYIIDGYERLRIQSVESQLPIRRVAPIGARMPLSVGASSKVLVAYSNQHEQEMIFQHLKTKEQIDLVQYKKQLTKVKTNGYATSFEEREPGTSALSVPIQNRSGEILAALTISGPINRLTYRRIKEILPILQESQKRLNRLILL